MKSALELYVEERKSHIDSYCKSFGKDPASYNGIKWGLDKVVELWKNGELPYRDAMKKAVELW